nr:galactokinase-3 [Saccharomyces cerevisiae]
MNTNVPIFSSPVRDLPRSFEQKHLAVVDAFFQTYHVNLILSLGLLGRVNLIGEHIDYCDFSVLPLAIDVDMLCAVKILDEKNPSITLTNADPKFAQRKFDLPLDGSYMAIDPSVSEWSNYFKCGLHVAHSYLKKIAPERFNNTPLVGAQIFCQSDIPTGGGLSSAFTCAGRLATIRANMGKNFDISKKDLTASQRLRSTMLESIMVVWIKQTSVYGEEDHALYVEFMAKTKWPHFQVSSIENHEISFVIAILCTRSNNRTLLHISLSCSLLTLLYISTFAREPCGPDTLGLTISQGQSNSERGNLEIYGCLLRPDTKTKPNHGMEISELVLNVYSRCYNWYEESFSRKKSGFTVHEASTALNCSREEFTRDYLTTFPVRFQVLKLYQRAKHVYSESLRVLKALKMMTSAIFTRTRFLYRFWPTNE